MKQHCLSDALHLLWLAKERLWLDSEKRIRTSSPDTTCPGTVWRTESEGTSAHLFFPHSPLSPLAQSFSSGPAHPPLDTQIKPKLIPSTRTCSEAWETAQQLSQSTQHPLMCVPAGDKTVCGEISFNFKNMVFSEDTPFTRQNKPTEEVQREKDTWIQFLGSERTLSSYYCSIIPLCSRIPWIPRVKSLLHSVLHNTLLS